LLNKSKSKSQTLKPAAKQKCQLHCQAIGNEASVARGGSGCNPHTLAEGATVIDVLLIEVYVCVCVVAVIYSVCLAHSAYATYVSFPCLILMSRRLSRCMSNHLTHNEILLVLQQDNNTYRHSYYVPGKSKWPN